MVDSSYLHITTQMYMYVSTWWLAGIYPIYPIYIYIYMQVSYIYIYVKLCLLKPSPTSNQVLMGCHCRKRGPQRHNSQQRNGNVQGPLSTPQHNLHLQILLLSQNCILHLLWFQTYVFSTNATQIKIISTSNQCDARCHYVNSNWYSGQLNQLLIESTRLILLGPDFPALWIRT